MILHAYIVTDDKGREFRYERYTRAPESIHDRMAAEDSAVRAFITSFKKDPTAIREVPA